MVSSVVEPFHFDPAPAPATQDGGSGSTTLMVGSGSGNRSGKFDWIRIRNTAEEADQNIATLTVQVVLTCTSVLI